ncbi:hypothetical protein [Ramlibacter sp.]|uniref:hypothetical protein n=1 Tax=Ramlibacter sp. TaxID=1917967 RepID=UPI003D0FD4D9
MSATTFELLVQAALAGLLMWTCLCRVVKTDQDTHREVRWAIVFEGLAAGLVLGAPVLPILMPNEATWAPWTTPLWVWIALLAAVALVQIVTAKYWAGGRPPEQFQGRNVVPMSGVGVFAFVVLINFGLFSVISEARAQTTEVTSPIRVMAAGDELRCNTQCVAMPLWFFEKMVELMEKPAAAPTACRKGPTT